MILQKPDEKTAEPARDQDHDKTLVEKPEGPAKVDTEPLSILSYDLNLSDDFSSLVDQFKDLKVSPIEIKKLQQQDIFNDLVVKMEEEKVQVEPVLISVTDKKPPLSVTTTRSRRTSASSKRSQKSPKSSKSSRRLHNEKKHLKHQQPPSAATATAAAAAAITTTPPPSRPPQQQKYIERSLDEMMRIPDIYERLAFYEKTLDLCLKADSPIASWCTSNAKKGKPAPLLEGYVPPARLLSPELPQHSDFGSMSSTFSESISMFLKKATISTPSASKRYLAMDNNGYGTPYVQSSNSSSIFGRSISRLSLSRSTQVPRYDHTTSSPSTHRFYTKNKIYNNKSSLQQQQQMQQMQQGLPPLSIDYSSSSSTYIATPRSTSSTPTSFGSTSSVNSRGESTVINPELAYMMNVLPQIDMRILQNALNEAKGDPMVAISIAVSASKQRFNELNSPGGAFKSTKSRGKRYTNKA
ncbi:hypothetical protein BD408DRAFT_422668 [Parasitella parasitica]|nr:hypothetical protein BD408DRAFT_422668 [Parasitella parasitica]